MTILAFLFVLSLVLNVARIWRMDNMRQVPKNLLRLKAGFEKGKPNRRFWYTLRAKEPGFDTHYRKVPGRMSCCVLPLTKNGEDVWQLRIGFKETAADKPTKYISIPVYANGQIYEY